MRNAFGQHTRTATPIDISFTRVSGEIQSVAAGTVALRRVYDDPVGAVDSSGPADAEPEGEPAGSASC